MQQQITALAISSLHKECIIEWKQKGITHQYKDFYQLVEENHAFNFQLWHTEDKARRDDMGFEYVYQAKREIDAYNQLRNNRMEAMDEWLINHFNPATHHQCPVNSESPGMIIDRLSILALKHYHMALQTTRSDVSEDHRNKCQQRTLIIEQQLQQLKLCLEEFFEQIIHKTRTFRVYHQFKMYNDPNLNPQLYDRSH